MISCGGEKVEQPDYLWEEEYFIEVLTEFQKAESLVRLGYHKFPDSIYSKDSIYEAFFEKMEISGEDLDSNYRYYLRDPERMEKIYDQVIINLSEQAAELEKEKKKKKKAKKANKTKKTKKRKDQENSL